VGQNVPNEDSAGGVIDLRNQAKVIALDVEDGEYSYSIRGREHFSHFFQAPPSRPSS
jgi:hypothetical protein